MNAVEKHIEQMRGHLSHIEQNIADYTRRIDEHTKSRDRELRDKADTEAVIAKLTEKPPCSIWAPGYGQWVWRIS